MSRLADESMSRWANESMSRSGWDSDSDSDSSTRHEGCTSAQRSPWQQTSYTCCSGRRLQWQAAVVALTPTPTPARALPLRQQRRSIKRRNHKLLHDSLDQKPICAQASASDGCKKMLVGGLRAARGASRRDLCAPRYHSRRVCQSQSHRFLRPRISRVASDASRERPARPHSHTSMLLRGLFVRAPTPSIDVSHVDAGRRCLACAPSGLLAPALHATRRTDPPQPARSTVLT